ncbi:plasma membrane fusion protein prm1 [Trapelia coarctata]|nr:plasma membrane fusion protein prm1 [Trapelia coarctata]
MASARNQYPSTFPTVPPSLSAGDHGMSDYYAAQGTNTQRTVPHTLPEITPYLGLRARLSQVWINRWTILLLLVLARTLIAIAGLHNDLDSAEREAMTACTKVESMGSALASMPHYMSQGVNEMAASGVEKAINGLMSMLFLTITGVEEIVVFYINMLTSTYVCLITLAVSGSLHVAISIAEDVNKFLNTTLGTIGQDLHKGIDGFQNDLNRFLKGLSSIPGFGKTPPSINIDNSLNALNHIQLPASINEGLDKLNSSIPTFAQVNNFTNNAIRFPFEEVKKLLNGTLHVFHLDRSIFPVPQKDQLTFCSDNNGIHDFFKILRDLADMAKKIFLGVLIIAAILACVPMAYRDIRRWRTMQERAVIVADRSIDPLDIIYIASRPYTATAGIKVADKFRSKRRQILTRWVIAYATSPAAIFVLSLAIAGLFSCLCQYILLKAIMKEVPALVNEIDGFAVKVIDSLNNASQQWSNGTNQVIISTNNDINHDVFGWVNTTTGALNDTLNVFVDGMTKVLNDTFGGTVLYDPIMGVMNCLIGVKIAGIEKGLTWVSDHAHVDFPLFPNNVFAIGSNQTIVGNGTNSANGGTLGASAEEEATDAIAGAVTKVTDHIADAIRTEALISTTILLIWVFIVLCGVFRAIFLSFKHDKIRGEGGPSYAGDIPLEMQRPVSAAPAYTPPSAEPSRQFAAFLYPMGTHPANREQGDGQDQKLGFAGQRAPPGRVDGVHGVRGSEYGFIGDEKR